MVTCRVSISSQLLGTILPRVSLRRAMALVGAATLVASSGVMPLDLSAESNPEGATKMAPRDANAPSVAEGRSLTTMVGEIIQDGRRSLVR